MGPPVHYPFVARAANPFSYVRDVEIGSRRSRMHGTVARPPVRPEPRGGPPPAAHGRPDRRRPLRVLPPPVRPGDCQARPDERAERAREPRPAPAARPPRTGGGPDGSSARVRVPASPRGRSPEDRARAVRAQPREAPAHGPTRQSQKRLVRA